MLGGASKCWGGAKHVGGCTNVVGDRIVWIIIPACLIKQPNGTLSRMYVQTFISVK